MGFLWGFIAGLVGGPFLWELLKFGYKKLKEVTAK